jgi:hypothetical protein
MPKKRRTKKQKQHAQNRRKQGEITGFKVDIDSLGLKQKSAKKELRHKKTYKSYLRIDLTRTILLTMLAVALELALWHYFFR